MSATIKGPYNYIAGTGISATAVLNTSTGQFDVTITNTAPSAGGTLTATSVSGPGFWYSNASTLETTAVILGGDVNMGTHSTGLQTVTVQGLRGAALPALAAGNLNYSGSAWQFVAPTSVVAGSGIGVSSGPAYTVSIAASGVTAGTYGDATHVPSITVGSDGRITAVSSVAISGGVSTPVSVPNGGTGATSFTAHSVLLGEGTAAVSSTGPNASTGIPLVSQGASADPSFGTASVSGGGTGVATLTSHGVLIGQGTASVNVTSPGTAGQVLLSNGASADPSFGAVPTTPIDAEILSRIASGLMLGSLVSVTGAAQAINSITLTTGTSVVILARFKFYNQSGSNYSAIDYCVSTVSGNIVSPETTLVVPAGVALDVVYYRHLTGLTAGSNTFFFNINPHGSSTSLSCQVDAIVWF